MRWLTRAACTGEDPALFDHFTFPEAREALRICSNCRHVTDCMDWVKPNKSFYDGVAAGVVWRNGYRVRFDNTTREDRLVERRLGGRDEAATTEVPRLYWQGTLPFDGS